MTITRTWLLLLALGGLCAQAQPRLTVIPSAESQCVFSATMASVKAVFHNAGNMDFSGEITLKLFLESSSTVAPLSERHWKNLKVLAGQTTIESAPLEVPKVDAAMKILVRWCGPTGNVAGDTEVTVYPTNLLRELKRLAGDDGANFGVLDPHHQLQPALKLADIRFVDLEERELTGFSGKLALIGECNPDDPGWNGLAERVRAVARKGTPVVWVQRAGQDGETAAPSYYVAPQNGTAVVVAQPEMVANLTDNPRSQINLIRFCKLALCPEAPALPNLSRK